ncbi:zinc ribbon domain-containing protein [Okeania sp. SIO3B5]|uniref:zinc ribbon domain-containing protein n=1 Tax=Okeania sp. SIO3B5 TaxID=2607811 RepID=UPI0034538778
MLPYVCWKRGKYYGKVDKDYTSQECPLCGQIEKKKLSDRRHNCTNCGYEINRDIAAAPTPIPSREGSKRGG